MDTAVLSENPVLIYQSAWKKTFYRNCFIRIAAEVYTWKNTGLFEMIVGILTTCHTQYT